MTPENVALPAFDGSRSVLPAPFWEGHESTIVCYWKAWELASSHLMRPEPASGFIANFIDPAFNDCLFMWDSCFMVMFGRYGARAFPFVRTLDNLYAKQHPDGFICRDIGRADGDDRFFRYDPGSTGPNVFAWTEWEHYRNSGNRERLARVLGADGGRRAKRAPRPLRRAPRRPAHVQPAAPRPVARRRHA